MIASLLLWRTHQILYDPQLGCFATWPDNASVRHVINGPLRGLTQFVGFLSVSGIKVVPDCLIIAADHFTVVLP